MHMEKDKSLLRQQEVVRGGAEPVLSDDIVGAAQKAQEESIMFLLAGKLDPEALNGPDHSQLSIDKVLGQVA